MSKKCKSDKATKPENARYECKRCGRKAKKDEKLCKPEKLEKR